MNDNNLIKEKIISKISMSKFREENMIMKRRKKYFSKKIGLIACACFILTAGVVFAKDIENIIKDKFGLGNGIQTAVDNGYIGNNETDFIKSDVLVCKGDENNILDTFDVGVKINDFLMDNTTLNIEFEVKFDEKINEYKDLGKKINGNIDYESFGIIEFSDLFILDEKNILITSSLNENVFNEFCNKHNLGYELNNFNDTYLMSNTNATVTEIDDTTNTLKMIYSIGVDNMPNSRELNISFNEIKLSPKTEVTDKNDIILLIGEWNLSLEIPEFMYNREDIFYKVVSCENEDFNIYEAKASDTGFELGIIVSNIEKPVMPEKLSIKDAEIMGKGNVYYSSKDEFIELYGGEEYAVMYEEYYTKLYPISTNGYHYYTWGELTDGCYIQDLNGKKFSCSKNIDRKAKAKFIDDNKYDYYNTFEMTKYDATDKITIVIDFYKEPVKIELEKI